MSGEPEDPDRDDPARARGLADAAMRLAAQPTLASLAEAAAHQACALLGCAAAATRLTGDPAGAALFLSGEGEPLRRLLASAVGAAVCAEAVRAGAPVHRRAAELGADEPLLHDLLAAPLAGSPAPGVLVAAHHREDGFTRRDEGMLAELARLVGALAARARAEVGLRRGEQRLRATVEHAGVGLIEADAGARILEANAAFCAMTGWPRESLIGRTFLSLTHPDDAAPDAERYSLQVAGALDTYQVEKRYVRGDGEVAWVQVSSTAVRDGAGRFLYGVRVGQDVTERRRAEAGQALLLGELDHRVKNTLARVQSVAAQTLRAAASPGAFYEAFEGRLGALASSHSLLNEAGWTGATVAGVVEAALASYRDGAGPRWRLDGPEVALSARATLSLGLVLHELATNAARHGALRDAGGLVEVGWRTEPGADGGPGLRLDWLERGGPDASRPSRPGLGSRLIRVGVGHELGGEVHLDHRPEGLRCTITVPLEG